MKVRYLGHSCFEFTAKDGSVLLTDPYTGVGYELAKGLTADIVTVSHGHFDHAYTQGLRAGVIVEGKDEVAFRGITIEGIESHHDDKQGALRGKNRIYKMRIDGLTFCHLGDIGESCSNTLVEKIGEVDVLMLPVGGTYTVDAAGAMEYVEKIRPRVVLPMHYKPQDGSLDITGIQPFLTLCKEYTHVADGKMEIDENTNGIFYMERVK